MECEARASDSGGAFDGWISVRPTTVDVTLKLGKLRWFRALHQGTSYKPDEFHWLRVLQTCRGHPSEGFCTAIWDSALGK